MCEQKPVEEPVKAAEPEPAAVVPAVPKVVAAPVVAATNVTDKVALVVASGSPAGESLKARTLEVLQARGISQVTVTSVLSLLQLPFATKQLLARGGGFTSVIVIAAITEEVRHHNHHHAPSGEWMGLPCSSMECGACAAGVGRQGGGFGRPERHCAGTVLLREWFRRHLPHTHPY